MTGVPQPVEAEEFIGNELLVGRGLQRHELTKGFENGLRPGVALVTPAGLDAEAWLVLEPEGSELVETGFPDIKKPTSLLVIKGSGVEVGKSVAGRTRQRDSGWFGAFHKRTVARMA